VRLSRGLFHVHRVRRPTQYRWPVLPGHRRPTTCLQERLSGSRRRQLSRSVAVVWCYRLTSCCTNESKRPHCCYNIPNKVENIDRIIMIFPLLYNGTGDAFSQNCPFRCVIRAHTQYVIPRVHQVHAYDTPNGISIGSSVFVGFAVVTNRQTHRPRYVCNNRPHLWTACMQWGLIITLCYSKLVVFSGAP